MWEHPPDRCLRNYGCRSRVADGQASRNSPERGLRRLPPALLNERVSLRLHADHNDRAIVTLTLDWDRATFHPIDDRTQRLEVPLPQQLGEDARTSLASAVVGLEVVGGPIEDAKLSRSHIRMEITRDADIEAIKHRLQALVDRVLSLTDETSN
jgi:hypothetical protein